MGEANAGVTKGRSVAVTFLILCLVTAPIGANVRAVENDEAEKLYFRGVDFYIQKQYYPAASEFLKAIKLKPDYAEARSAFEATYARLESSNSMASSSSPVGVCLGAYSGCMLGGAIPLIAVPVSERDKHGYPKDSTTLEILSIVSGVAGAVAGGYLGWIAYKEENGRILLYSTGVVALGVMLGYLPQRLGLLPQ